MPAAVYFRNRLNGFHRRANQIRRDARQLAASGTVTIPIHQHARHIGLEYGCHVRRRLNAFQHMRRNRASHRRVWNHAAGQLRSWLLLRQILQNIVVRDASAAPAALNVIRIEIVFANQAPHRWRETIFGRWSRSRNRNLPSRYRSRIHLASLYPAQDLTRFYRLIRGLKNFCQHARNRRGNLHRDLIGADLDHRLVRGHSIARFFQPYADNGLRSFALIGEHLDVDNGHIARSSATHRFSPRSLRPMERARSKAAHCRAGECPERPAVRRARRDSKTPSAPPSRRSLRRNRR